MIHIIAGDEDKKNLRAAFDLDENLRGEVLVLKDTLGIGNILSTPEIGHDEIRTETWRTIIPGFEQLISEESTLKEGLSNAIQHEEPMCFWMAPCVSDVCAYYWLLPYFKSLPGVLHTINIIGLPFLNEKGQMFYPNNFSEVPPKEFIKTKRLLKEVSVSEFEVEGDEWSRLQQENTWVRIYEGGKKISSKDITYFDTTIKNLVGAEKQKGSKLVQEAMKKITQSLNHHFIEYRLRQLLQQGAFLFTGNVEGPLKEIEVSKLGTEVEAPNETL